MQPCVESIFVGEPETLSDERGDWVSSIARKPVLGAVELTRAGLRGDRVEQPYHGGPDAAVCVHVCDHYRFWNRTLGTDLQPGAVGENLTLDGVIEETVCVGDTVRVGTALVQVSEPRMPCATLARRLGRPDWVKQTMEQARTGFYLRVLEPGTLQPGDAWEIEERPHPGASIPALVRCRFHSFDEEAARRFAAMEELADGWREQFRVKLERA